MPPTQQERIDWPDSAVCALSIVVNVEEGSEMTVARGDRGMAPVDELGIPIKSPIRNYGNESRYLCGNKTGAPRVVALLRKFGFAAASRDLGHEPVIGAIRSA